MEKQSPVIIVSAFGRGHWLAASLASEGIPATLIDVTLKMGVWPVEDIEGPFGFFRSEVNDELQLERIYSGDPFEEVANGFSLWTRTGPIEIKGPVAKHQLDKSGLHPQVRNIINGSADARAVRGVYKSLGYFSFNWSWMLHLAHQWASTTYVANAIGAEQGDCLPLHSPFLIRKLTRNSLEKNLQWLTTKNVKVLRPEKIVDISFSGRKSVNGLELSAESGGVIGLEKMVWMLSSEETHYYSSHLGEKIFPQGMLEPEWVWMRYRLSLADFPERERLPQHCLLIADKDSPWTHENLIVLQRTMVPEQFDFWIRVPNVQRFNKEYIQEHGEKIKLEILERMPLVDPQVLNYPQEYYYNYAQLGPARYPVYASSSQRRNLQRLKNVYHKLFSNVFHDGPESWTNFTWSNYFNNQSVIFRDIQGWWQDKLARAEKERRRAEQRSQ